MVFGKAVEEAGPVILSLRGLVRVEVEHGCVAAATTVLTCRVFSLAWQPSLLRIVSVGEEAASRDHMPEP